KPSDSQIDHPLPTANRQVAEIALVTTVERFRPRAALRTLGAGRFAADGEVHDLVAQLYLLDNEPSARRQQQLRIHRPPYGWPGGLPGRSVLPGQSGAMQVAQTNLDILVGSHPSLRSTSFG